MSQIGIALIGLGRAGKFHLQSLGALSGVRLCCVCDLDDARATKVADELGCQATRDPAEAMRADGVDAVIVATPTGMHHEQVTTALVLGKHVLSEKPLGTSLAEIDRCFGLARERQRALLVAFQRRFDPSFAQIASSAQSGEIGQLQFIRSVSRDSPVPSVDYIRSSGGFFHDCLVHDFDMIGHIAQDTPEEVFSFGSSFIPEIGALGDVDNAAVALRFASGLLATIDASRKSVYGYDQRLEVFGSQGMLRAENRPQTLTVRSDAAGSSGSPVDFSFPTRYRDAYRLELECFLEAVRGNRELPITHDDVRRSHLLAEAAGRSAREGRAVRLDEIEAPAGAL